MKKILISILYVLLFILAYFALFNGISFANIKVLSVEQIIQQNDNLTNQIEELKSLLKKDYAGKQEGLATALSKLLQEKETYYDLASVSTENEITKANTEETYLIEYLWTRVGRHATSEGVNIKMDVNTGDSGEADIKNLSFTVDGQYIAIINFVSELEDDDHLNFRIEDFKMTGSDGNLTAKFTVRNVRIKVETTTNINAQNLTNTEDTNNTNTVEDTNNINETNDASNANAVQ